MKEIRQKHLSEVCEKVAAQCRAEGLNVVSDSRDGATFRIGSAKTDLNTFRIAIGPKGLTRDGTWAQSFVPDAWPGDEASIYDEYEDAVCRAGWKARIIQLLRQELAGYLSDEHLGHLRFAEECFTGVRVHPLLDKAKEVA